MYNEPALKANFAKQRKFVDAGIMRNSLLNDATRL